MLAFCTKRKHARGARIVQKEEKASGSPSEGRRGIQTRTLPAQEPHHHHTPTHASNPRTRHDADRRRRPRAHPDGFPGPEPRHQAGHVSDGRGATSRLAVSFASHASSIAAVPERPPSAASARRAAFAARRPDCRVALRARRGCGEPRAARHRAVRTARARRLTMRAKDTVHAAGTHARATQTNDPFLSPSDVLIILWFRCGGCARCVLFTTSRVRLRGCPP